MRTATLYQGQDQRYESGEGKVWFCRRCLSYMGLLICLLGFVLHRPAVAGVVFGDFNGDGFKDLAVGVPNQNVGFYNEAGLVRVVYGSETGLKSGLRNQTFHAGHLGKTNQTNAHFGKVLAAADFNGDGFDELVVGEPDRDVILKNDGAVYVFLGSSGRLTSINSRFITRPGGGKFGSALATGDFNGDTLADLAIGSPNSLPPDLVVGGIFAAHSHGIVEVIYGRSFGLDASKAAGPMPSLSATPGRKFSITTSTRPARARIRSTDSLSLRSSTRLFLLRFITVNRALSPFFIGPMAR